VHTGTSAFTSSQTSELSRSVCGNCGMGFEFSGLESTDSDAGKISIDTSPEQQTNTVNNM